MMAGRTGFQSWPSHNYKQESGSYQQMGTSEQMWDDEPSVAHVTRVFYNQSLTNNVSDEWDAWDGNHAPNNATATDRSNKVDHFGRPDYRRDGMYQSGASGRCSDRFGQQNESLDSGGDGAPYDMKISSRQVGLVIGKGGSRIRELQEASGARINVKKNDVDASGMVLVTLDGDVDSRSNAKRMIDELIESDSKSSSGGRMDTLQNRQTSGQFGDGHGGFHDTSGLTIASNMLGAVIGRGGQKIREIEDKTQTKVKIGDNRRGAMVEVTISGSDSGRQQAKQLIEDVIQSESETDRSQSRPAERSGFGDSHVSSKQQRAGFGSFGDSHVSSQERSGFGSFGDSHVASQVRSGFGGSEHSEPTNQSFGNSGRSGFGSAAPRHGFGSAGTLIDWDHVKQLSQLHEEVKWKDYPPIKKNFYIEDAGVANMEPEEVAAIREENNKIMVSCDEDSEACVPNPVRNFDEGFLHYPEILSELKRAGFSKPSPIQMQGWPIALQGLDLIGIAQTGTGKTLAFLLPAFIHIEGQPVPRGKRGGPNVLVLSPTRELALQVSKISFV